MALGGVAGLHQRGQILAAAVASSTAPYGQRSSCSNASTLCKNYVKAIHLAQARVVEGSDTGLQKRLTHFATSRGRYVAWWVQEAGNVAWVHASCILWLGRRYIGS
jgi:hypothetical protein